MKFSRKSTARIIAVGASVFAIHGVAASFVMRELGIHEAPVSVSQRALTAILDRNADRLYQAMPVGERGSTGASAQELASILAWYDQASQGCVAQGTTQEDSKSFGSSSAEMACAGGSRTLSTYAQSVNDEAPEGAVLPSVIYVGLHAKYGLQPDSEPQSAYHRGLANAFKAEAPELRSRGFEGMTGFGQDYRFSDWNRIANTHLAIAERLEAREKRGSRL